MTCHCHDPHVFGHLSCPAWETQPKSRHPLIQADWAPHQYRTLTQGLVTLTGALRAAENSMGALQTAWNHPEPSQSP